MTRLMRILGQLVVYAAFAALIGYFSDAPSYVFSSGETANITLSFAHGANRKEKCRRLTQEELEKLAPNMRKPVSCPRERLPVLIKIELDGKDLFTATLPPTGLTGDGPSRVYKKFSVPAGRHVLVARLRDTNRTTGYDYNTTRTIDLAPAQNLALDFRADIGGFVLE